MHYNAEIFHGIALLCTLLVEGIGMALWARHAYPCPQRAIFCALAVNLVVHTLFWYTQPLFVAPFFGAQWPLGLYCSELLVVLIEGATYARILHLPSITGWLLSFSLNLASFLIGLWLWQILL